MVIGT